MKSSVKRPVREGGMGHRENGNGQSQKSFLLSNLKYGTILNVVLMKNLFIFSNLLKSRTIISHVRSKN